MDFNDDDRLDLIVGDRYGTVNYFRRLASGELTEEPDIVASGVTINVGYNSAPFVVDWNGDGLLDLLIGNDTSPERIRLYLNSGTPSNYVYTTYTELEYSNGTPISYSRCIPTMYDLNNDGKRDLIIGEDYGHVYYLENVNQHYDPVFDNSVMLEAEGQPISFPSGYTDLKVWVNDWNEDGTGDLIVGNYQDSVHLYIAYPIGVEEQSAVEVTALNAKPNPTTDHVTINYQLSRGGEVELFLYDIQGRKIKTFGKEYHTTGMHTVFWDGRDKDGILVPAGIYFYRVTTPDSKRAGKLIYLR